MDINKENDLASKTQSAVSPGYADNASKKPSEKAAGKKFDITDHGGLLFIVIIAVVLLVIADHFLFRNKADFRRSSDGTRKMWEKGETDDLPTGMYLLKTLAQAQDSTKEEIGNIRKENGLPEQVFQRNIPPDENVGALITKEFSSFSQVAYDFLRDCISGSGPWQVDQVKLQARSDIFIRYKPQRDRLRELLDKPDAKFEQDFLGTPLGLIPDDANIDSSWSYLTLEECEIARCLQEEDMDGAVEALKYILRFTYLAGQTQFSEMRIQVAYMRENALRILQVLALDPEFTSEHATAIFQILRQTLQDWPSDAKAWIGERAEHLRRFELIRQGRVSEALREDEQETLRFLDILGESRQTKRTISLLDQVAFRSCDKDQEYYLKAMRTLIDSCSQPFYARLKTLNGIMDDLKIRQGKKDYPAVSMLFLQGIREAMQTQAMDKRLVEAWYLVLASSLKRPVREGAVDPMRGKPYMITRAQTPGGSRRIYVNYGIDDGKVEAKE